MRLTRATLTSFCICLAYPSAQAFPFIQKQEGGRCTATSGADPIGRSESADVRKYVDPIRLANYQANSSGEDKGFALSKDRRWLVLASRVNLQEAIDFTNWYKNHLTGIKIFRSSNGWFAIVSGPYQYSEKLESWKLALISANRIPADARLMLGSNYVEEVWTAERGMIQATPSRTVAPPAPSANTISPERTDDRAEAIRLAREAGRLEADRATLKEREARLKLENELSIEQERSARLKAEKAQAEAQTALQLEREKRLELENAVSRAAEQTKPKAEIILSQTDDENQHKPQSKSTKTYLSTLSTYACSWTNYLCSNGQNSASYAALESEEANPSSNSTGRKGKPR